MTTYYVSPSGNNSNNGLGPDASHASNKPWLTIAKALGASGIASGDTVHICAGTYRESVTVAMTSATVNTNVLGDPGNAQGFKDGSGVLLASGDVIWTAYTTNDATAPAATATLILSGRDFLTFQSIIFVSGSASNNAVDATATNSINITFRDCMFIPGAPVNTLIRYDGLADIAGNWTFDRCIFPIGGTTAIRLGFPTSAVADYDTNIQIQNCLFSGAWDTTISINTTGAAAFKPGGVDVLNCTMLGRNAAVIVNGTNMSTTIPCTVYNCIIATPAATALSGGASGQLVEDWNKIHATTARSNVSTGANSISTNAYPILLEFGQWAISGRAPRMFGTPAAGSPLLGFGNQAGAPSVDLLNRPRPAGGASVSNAIGALERHDTLARETSVTQAGATAAKIIGPGDHDFQIPVEASATVLTIYARYDTTHDATNKPQVILLANGAIGVVTQTKTMTAAADTWEQLTFSSFTPSAKGFVTLRCVSRPAAGGGIAYFDTAAGGASNTAGFDYFRNGEPLPALIAGAAAGGLIGGGGLTGGMQ